MSISIAVIIVTYNRLELLKECIEHALNQTIQPYRIIIIDNASTDGTADYLDSTYRNDARFFIRHEKENTGGAGGFCSGVQCAMETEAEWFMLIDDDAILDYDCFLKMCEIMKQKKAGAYACTVMSEGIVDTHHRRTKKNPVNEKAYNSSYFSCDLASFCGLMISKTVVEKIGLPLREYFIWYDDTEYCMRIRKHTEIIVCTCACLDHKTQPVTGNERGNSVTWKNYYGVRNHIDALVRHREWRFLLSFLKANFRIITQLLRASLHGTECKYALRLYKNAIFDGLLHHLGKNPDYEPGITQVNR